MGRIGRLIADRYRLVEKLGTGGMSVVWRAQDAVLGRDVAVKILSPRLAGDRALHDRMRQEALAAARLCHPHITAIFDFGEQATVPFVVMELIDGESVSARLRRTGPLPWTDAVTATAEVASALAAAHARGIVHRDVTPANVMLTATGAKVVDFGISALVGQRDAAPDGSLLGTPAYLAPERLAGGQVLPAADVYALGLLLYRMLTARLPWPAGNTAEALRAHLYADPEPLPAGLPADVTTLVMRCLAKNPADRPPASEVATRLGAVAGLPAFVTPAPPPPTRSWDAVQVVRNLRLRTELRLSRALRLGRAKPLGGGLFQGGQLAHQLVSGRHRVQAAVATLMLVAVVAVVWTTSRQPDEAGPAQAAAAAAGTPAGVVHTAECKVRYRVDHDTGDDFLARVTVVNTGDHAVDEGWRMEFAFPGSQRLHPVRAVEQNGRRVVVRGRKDLGPGRSITVDLRGAYRGTNALPLAFRLDGHECRAEVVGATVPPPTPAPSSSAPAPSSSVKAKVTPKKRPPSTPPASSSRPAPPRTSTPSPSVEPRRPSPPSPSPAPPGLRSRSGGFSVTV